MPRSAPAFLLFIIISGIAISLLNQAISDYNQLIAGSVAQERSINAMNFKFKVQVQEWKNVLLRGKDPQKLTQYWNQFEEMHNAIQREGAELDKHLSGDSHLKVEAFLRAIAVVFLVLMILRKSLLQPLALINDHLGQLADGNFRQPLRFNGSGELGRLGANIDKVQQSVAEVISDLNRDAKESAQIARQLDSTAKGLENQIAHFAI